MKREPDSHKGQNGAVAVIGGSYHMHGAPILTALACEAAGVDLLYPCVPVCHAEATKNASPNFICSNFRGNDLSTGDASAIEEVIGGCNAAVIGPGLATYDKAQKAMKQIIQDIQVPVVIDGGALQAWTFDLLDEKQAIVTPHIRELGRMQGQVLDNRQHEDLKDIAHTIADARDVTILLKGPIDIIAGPEGRLKEIAGGNAGLTVGGTGDVLAGLITGLVAQGLSSFEACVMGTTIVKKAATELYEVKGYAFTAMDIIGAIPKLVHSYKS